MGNSNSKRARRRARNHQPTYYLSGIENAEIRKDGTMIVQVPRVEDLETETEGVSWPLPPWASQA